MTWKKLYRATLVEIDRTRRLSLIHETVAAIRLRSKSSPTVTQEEQQQMNDATHALGLLKACT
jgi:hypothetical protein